VVLPLEKRIVAKTILTLNNERNALVPSVESRILVNNTRVSETSRTPTSILILQSAKCDAITKHIWRGEVARCI
jgi:hypothetical protein